MRNPNTAHHRRSFIAASLAAGAALTLGPRALAGQQGGTAGGEDFPLGRTDEANLSADDTTLSPRVRALIRIGEDGIARENEAALRAFFHPDFRFHGPGEVELDRGALWNYFALCREAFDDFSVTRQAMVSDGEQYLACRTRFAGRFTRPFAGVPDGPLQPNGRNVEYRPINIFRYAPDGRLIEEWVQYDVGAFHAQLRRPA